MLRFLRRATAKPPEPKPRVLFVGAFRPSAGDGTVGGQMYACRSLVASPLARSVEFHLLDTLQRSLPPPGLVTRAADAARRLAVYCGALLFSRINAVLVFSSFNALSLAEKGTMCILAKWRGARVVLSLRSEIRADFVESLPAWFLRRMFQSVDTVICQSEAAAVALRERWKVEPGSLQIIPNWINSSEYRGCRDGRPESAVCTFLYLGWLEQRKGINDLIEAFAVLRHAGRPFRAVVCGGGPQRSALEARCRELGVASCIEFRGWVTGQGKMDALREADVLVLPSYSEGMPNAVLEAMAAGLAVIATPVGGVPTLVQQGRNAILVSPGDVSALADAMQDLAQDGQRARAMGAENVRSVERSHDINHVWPRVAEALGIYAGEASKVGMQNKM